MTSTLPAGPGRPRFATIVGAIAVAARTVALLLPLSAPVAAAAADQAAPAVTGALRSPDSALASGNSMRITDVTLFDGDRVVDGATVVVRDGFVTKVCAATEPQCADGDLAVVNGSGKFLMPALIDAEGHFSVPTDGLDRFFVRDKPVCAAGPDGVQRAVRVSRSAFWQALADRGLFTEVDTHGLRLANGVQPQQLGGRYGIAASANYEKHVRFGVTTVLDMAAYPWPANYVKRSRNQHRPALDAEGNDLRREFLVYADFYGSGMWAAPAGLHFGYYGTDPVYNLAPEGPWNEARLAAWVGRRVADGSDHIKVFYEKWGGAPKAPSLSAPTLRSLVSAAHARGLKVFVHNESEDTFNDLSRSGADVNIHQPGGSDFDRPAIGSAFAERVARSVRAVVPTMTAFAQACAGPFAINNRATHALAQRSPGASFVRDHVETADVLPYLNALDELRLAGCYGGGPSPDPERVWRNTARLFDHGTVLLAGTDAEALEPMVEGLALHHEIYMIHEALDRHSTRAKGPSANVEAPKAATSNAARVYGLHIEDGHKPRDDPRGFVKPGYRADLLLLRESPMKDILNTLKIERVYKAGYVANRQMVRPECASGDCESRRLFRDLEAARCDASP
jgi:imidazolonepropionase-like amidohydrolase